MDRRAGDEGCERSAGTKHLVTSSGVASFEDPGLKGNLFSNGES